MAVTPGELAVWADTALQGGGECNERAAISRHYYAVYHRALEWERATLPHLGNPVAPGPGGMHQELINRLKSPDGRIKAEIAKRSKFAGARLAILKARRTLADYKLGEPLVPGEAANQQAVTRAQLADFDLPG